MDASKELRRKHVASVRANFAVEEMHPDAEDLVLQERYIDGTASLDDLIKHAHAYADKHACLANIRKPNPTTSTLCEQPAWLDGASEQPALGTK